ncbi:hypothetical protein ETF27_07165 [Prevotella brunnea]|uniref:Uncharacterized protein n=2 Tax=Prevotella brunnea TaxID=2508867 RepID=A0A5C8GI42_9BACT|nr:hypothetical protein [Prevotella brunnea]TXJ61632.1 hypothetical protein ETF27_07165 [Prevotella brunnea]
MADHRDFFHLLWMEKNVQIHIKLQFVIVPTEGKRCKQEECRLPTIGRLRNVQGDMYLTYLAP